VEEPPQQRKSARVSLVSQVKISTSGLDEFAEEFSGNVSMGGIFIRTDHPFGKGTEVHLLVMLEPHGEAMIEAWGKVAWARFEPGKKGKEPAGMGIEFTRLSDASRHLLAAIVAPEDPD